MSSLPAFFQQKGKTLLDELADYELGGDLDEEDDEGIIDDAVYGDSYGVSDLELPSFFQPTARPDEQLNKTSNISSIDSGNFPLKAADVNLSSLLDNFQWRGKDAAPQSSSSAQKDNTTFVDGAPLLSMNVSKQNSMLAPPPGTSMTLPIPISMSSPHEYSEMLAQQNGTPSDRQASTQYAGQLQQYGVPPLGPDSSLRMNMLRNGMPIVMPMPMLMPPHMYHQQPPYSHHFTGPPPHFISGPNGPMPPPPNMHFYHHSPNFPQQPLQHPAQQQHLPQHDVLYRTSTEGSRGPPSADPRLQSTGPRTPPPPPPHTFQEPQEMLQQMLQQLQQPPPPSAPLLPRPTLLQHLDIDPSRDARMLRTPVVDRGRIQMFQQMAVTTAGPGTGTGTTPCAGYPKSEMMTSSDVRFVVNKVVSPLETNDPYSEDYYFLQSNYKKNAKKAEAAMLAGEPAPRPVYLPFPAWLETKNRIASQIEDTRKLFGDRSREWEEREQVLGHMQRTDVNRPKEQLHAPSLQDMLDRDAEMDGDTVFRMPFVSRLWNMRQAVQKGYEALYTLQELNHLLLSPLTAGNPPARDEILLQIDRAVCLLSQSVGIRPAHEGLLRPQGTGSTTEIALEGGLVAAILQTAKGKKLMSRSINLLIPEQRWALMPVILARVLQSDPLEQSIDEQAVEKKLLHTLTLFIEHSHEYQKNQQALVSSAGGIAPFTSMLLGNLRLCVKSVMVSQMEKSRLRTTLKFSRDRAVVMNVIVQIGDEVAEQAAETISTEWAQMREAFMCMLDE